MMTIVTKTPWPLAMIKHIRDPLIRAYWEQDWSALPERLRRERSLSTLNKLRTFKSDPVLRNIFGQERSGIDFRRVLDKRQIFIANLCKGQLGRNKSQWLGAILGTKFYLAAITRPKHSKLPPFTARIRITSENQSRDITADMQPKQGKAQAKAQKAIINHTRQKFSSPRKWVERKISELFE